MADSGDDDAVASAGAFARARLPEAARRFVEAELAAGNALVAVLEPPAGVVASIQVLLGAPARTRPRGEGPHWCFGELAPGLPAVVVLLCEPMPSDPPPTPQPAPPARRQPARAGDRAPDAADPVQRFRAGMAMDLDRWRDGTGHDLDAIDGATPDERATMLDLLLAHGLGEPRDVEAVARLGGPRARAVLRQHFDRGSTLHRLAVLRHAPTLVTDDERTAALVQALAEVRPYEGLSATLDLVADWHPAPVVEALWQAARHGPAERAVHAAAMLAWLHGLAAAPFDWDQRPFFLRFGDESPEVRAQACETLRRRIGALGPA